MPKPRTAKVVNGVLYPDAAHIKAVVSSLQRKVKADPKLARAFMKNPRAYLASAGLNEDLQRELLSEMQLKAPATALWCICTGCCKTCWCTACCITNINITRVTPQ